MKYTFKTEDENEAKAILQAFDSNYCIHAIIAYLRDYLKYRELEDDDYLRIEQIRDEILKIVQNYNITLLD